MRHEDHRQQARLAHDTYDRIRHDAHDIDDIASVLARTYPELELYRRDIESIKKHLFVEPVLVTDPSGQLVSQQKDPDPYIAEAWGRLREGKPKDADIGLLRHEQAEIAYLHEHPGVPIRDAHTYANQTYNWESQVPTLTRHEIEAIQEITDGGAGVFHEGSGRQPGSSVPLRRDGEPIGPDTDLRSGDASTDPPGRPIGSPIPGRSQEDPQSLGRPRDLAGQWHARELTLQGDLRDSLPAAVHSITDLQARDFASGGRFSGWRERNERHNEIRENFYKWQTARKNAEYLAREYLEAQQRVRPGIADKRFERFRAAQKRLDDFIETLGLDLLTHERGKNWDRFRRLFKDDPRSATLQVFSDKAGLKLPDDSPSRASDTDARISNPSGPERTEARYTAVAALEDYLLADNERDEARAADSLIEYMESMGLDDPKNWESFAENWRDGNGLGWLGELAINAADAFDIPIEELEPAVDKVSARSGITGKTGSVKPLDVGTYSDLKKHERVGDDLEHDHIPSSAALKKSKEKQLGRKLTAQEKKEIHDQGTAIEVPKEVHAKGDTWRHKNTQARIESDASNLSAAARRDYTTTRKNLIAYGYSAKEVDEALDKMRHANRRKGI